MSAFSAPRLGIALLAMSLAPLRAGDWPQILGPNRNGEAVEERLLSAWPADGPQVLWRQPLGAGYAGVAVAGGRVFAFHRPSAGSHDSERLECFEAASGRSLWKADFPASYRGGIDPDKGPRCVPLAADNTVYAMGAAGDLQAVALDSGAVLWSRDLYADYRADEGYFGAGSTPILVAGQLLVNVGGRGAGIVALDPATGKTLWQASDEGASYSSPALLTRGGQSQAIFVTRLNCILADPAKQRVQVLFPFGQRGPTVNAATPLVLGDRVFVAASYGVGAALAALDVPLTKKLWASNDTLSSQYATPVFRDGFLYGIHGREDVGVAELRCVEAATGKVRWAKTGFGVAHLVLAQDKLLVQKVNGLLALAEAKPDGYRELAQARLTQSPTRALPALSHGRLFVRAGSGGGELICLQVGQP